MRPLEIDRSAARGYSVVATVRPITSTKSATGHLLGAARGLEAIFTILAVRDGRLPGTLNLDDPDPLAEGLVLVARSARTAAVEYAMSNGLGFGGVNASVLFKRLG